MTKFYQKQINDEYYTPYYAVDVITKYLNKDLVYWCCADTDNSNICRCLKDKGFKIINTDISYFNFLRDKPNFNFDAIITNPPYSLKDEFIFKCYEYKVPFALLLPLTALEGAKRNKLYRKYGIDLLVFDKRINFHNTTKKSITFNTSWFTYGIMNKQLTFIELDSYRMKIY